MPLTATIEVPGDQADAKALRVTLRITNQGDVKVSVLNPDMGVPMPNMDWPWSNETYQTSMLISYGFLSISVTDEDGNEVPQDAIQTWATPVLRPRIELAPGDSFEVTIPIGDFYQLESGKAYWVALTYGDKDVKVSARSRVTAP
ncbi:MAG TPA: hypothetical protein VEX13_18240 [Chloroflexia bacterium]|nr:hypothetical protein [Chloroflexia bacterium]